jgi:molybdopterin-guanine dinucleotide biosynthesis protein A
MPSAHPPVTAVVLCGGAARRFGADKVSADLGGRTVLDTLLDSLPEHWPVVCVGEERPTTRPVTWTVEEPPGGGPLAGLAAALPDIRTDVTVLLGGDMPLAGPTAVHLVEVLSSPTLTPTEPVHPIDAVAAHDQTGQVQPLLVAARTTALRGAVPVPAHGIPLMRLLDRLRVASIEPDPGGDVDIDTPEDLVRARRRLDA